MSEKQDWKCDTCGRVFKNVTPPVHHACTSRGVGDTVAKITKAVGIKPCGRCKKRQQKLNEMFPYKDKDNG
jgi:hypothetical protein